MSGLALERSHAAISATGGSLGSSGFERLEFDGLNLVTPNHMRRYPDALGAVTPCWAAGLGGAVPCVPARWRAGTMRSIS